MIRETMQVASPFLKWAGGKRQLLSELLPLVPRSFERYYEPFIGGGALFFALKPRSATISDINPELINAYEVVKTDVERLIEDLKLHPVNNSEYFYDLRNADRIPDYNYEAWSPLQKASRTIYLNKTCFNGLYRVNTSGQFNVSFGSYTNPTICDEDNLRACSKFLQRAEIINQSFESILDTVTRSDLVYLDPPYIPASDTANFTSYSLTGFDMDMHVKVRDVCAELKKRGVPFIASNSATQTTISLYEEFDIKFVEVPRAINSKGNRRGKVQEVIITANLRSDQEYR